MPCWNILPTQTLQLHYTCDLDSKLRSLTAQIVTLKTSFSRPPLQLVVSASFHKNFEWPCPTCRLAYSVTKIIYFYKICKQLFVFFSKILKNMNKHENSMINHEILMFKILENHRKNSYPCNVKSRQSMKNQTAGYFYFSFTLFLLYKRT